MLTLRRTSILTLLTLLPLTAALVAAAPAGPASAAGASSPAKYHRLVIPFGANKSTNWSGYNQGTVEQGSKLFNQISGTWTVPTATQHKAGEAENSSSWIGIGGGCVDASCTATDASLIQTGTEQDVAANGTPSYSAWWEIIPAPSLTISTMKVSPGDTMHANIAEVVPFSDVWTITLQDQTKGETFTQTVPYASTHLTAEWITETPTLIGTSGASLAAMPNLSGANFSAAKTNSAGAGLKPSEEIQLVTSSGQVLATPSAPNGTADGFSVCTYSGTC
ncbi:MAG TPA: G1 family glutamic endopeptidase [Acidimicrobiales bacterium]|nr:G1 family glutamic endopeptidase [Acidimicrobiales bacterium]